MTDGSHGHAFISYVREDAARVDRLESILRAAGIRVWRDTADLWPGQDWRGEIRGAITKDALAFIVCFSERSEARSVSGQNAELVLALEQLRLRRPGQPWLIPVRFDDVDVPDLDIGAGRTLNDLQRVDLVGESWDAGAARLVAGVLRILETPPQAGRPITLDPTLEARLKSALREPDGDIALNDLLMPIADRARADQADENRFPSTSAVLNGGEADAAMQISELVHDYMRLLDDGIDATITCATWARDSQLPTLRRFVERLAPPSAGGAGMTVLTSLRWFPLLPIAYSGGMAGVRQENFAALREIFTQARVNDPQDGRLPLIARANTWRPFHQFPLVAQLLAHEVSGEERTRELAEELRQRRRGGRYTPVSDFLHDALRSKFEVIVPDQNDYSDLFDDTEILLSLLMLDCRAQVADPLIYIDSPNLGRFTWRARYERPGSQREVNMKAELVDRGGDWPPLAAGLFGGSVERATAAFEQLISEAAEGRRRLW